MAADIEPVKKSNTFAKALLLAGTKLGANLMISKAYSKNHERQPILGGNTQYIVDVAKLPGIPVHLGV